MMIEGNHPPTERGDMPAKYTVLDGDRRYKQVQWGRAKMPICQAPMIDSHILHCDKYGEYDSPTTQGPWADLCYEHVLKFAPLGCTIGSHRIPTVKS